MAYMTPPDLQRRWLKARTQNGKNRIITEIFFIVPPVRKYFVEFGVGQKHMDKEYQTGLDGNCYRRRARAAPDHAESGWVFTSGLI